MHACRHKKKKITQIKSKGYRDGIKRKTQDKDSIEHLEYLIGMLYTVQVDDVICTVNDV